MREFTINLSVEDIDRLFAIKKIQGRDDMTGGEFGEYLLSKELRRLFPGHPETDENGEVTNAELYRGADRRRASAERMAYRVAETPEELDAVATELEKDLDTDGEIILPNGLRETAELISSVVRDTLRPITAEEAGV